MAGHIPDEDIDKVRDATDLVALFSEHTQVKQRGRDFWCCCPFHNEKTPSCKIDPDKQLWYCFGCHKHGNAFTFVMEMEGVSFPDAVRELAERAHITLHVQKGRGVPESHMARLRSLCAATARFYHRQLMTLRSPEADQARSYLAGRGLGGQIPKRWDLGFAPGRNALVSFLSSKGYSPSEMVEANVAVRSSRDGRLRDRFFDRIIFPISDVTGSVIAFGGRVIGTGEPKYLNSSDTPLFNKSRVLYGLDKAKEAMASKGQAIVVEGYTDVIAMHEGGLTNTVATLGTALTDKHIQVLRRHARKSVLYLFDGDAAGQHAIDRALQFISVDMTPEAGSRQARLLACTIPDGMDPAEYIGAHGGAAMEKELNEHAKPLIEFGFQYHTAKYHITADSPWTDRREAFNDAVQILAPIADTDYAAVDYARDFAQRLGVPGDPDEVARHEVAKLKRSAQARAQRRSMERARRQDAVAPGPRGAGGAPAQQRLNGVRHDMEEGAPSRDEAPADPAFAAAQRNEAAFERSFVRLCAERPDIAQAHADVLSQGNWADARAKAMAQVVSEELVAHPGITARQLSARLSSTCEGADEVLLGAQTPADGQSPEEYADYVSEELRIFDLSKQVEDARYAFTASGASMEPAERQAVFSSIADLQATLFQLKRQHAAKNA